MKKTSKIYLSLAIAAVSVVSLSSMVSGSGVSDKEVVVIQEVRSVAPFTQITTIGNNSGTAVIGTKHHDITVSFDFENTDMTDRVSNLVYSDVEVTSIYDVVIYDLDGNKVYDFTDYQDHAEFAAMIRHKLMEY